MNGRTKASVYCSRDKCMDVSLTECKPSKLFKCMMKSSGKDSRQQASVLTLTNISGFYEFHVVVTAVADKV